MKATEQYVPMVLFITLYKLSGSKLWDRGLCDHSNKNCQGPGVPYHKTVYYAIIDSKTFTHRMWNLIVLQSFQVFKLRIQNSQGAELRFSPNLGYHVKLSFCFSQWRLSFNGPVSNGFFRSISFRRPTIWRKEYVLNDTGVELVMIFGVILPRKQKRLSF